MYSFPVSYSTTGIGKQAAQKTWMGFFFFSVFVRLAIHRLRYLFLPAFSGAAFSIAAFSATHGTYLLTFTSA